MTIPVEWGYDKLEEITLVMDGELVDNMRKVYRHRCDMSGAALCMSYFEDNRIKILESGFMPDTVITTFGLAQQIQGLYMTYLSVRSVSYDGKLYNKLVMVNPVLVEMAIIPHRSAKAGELFVFDRAHTNNQDAVRYMYNLYDGMRW